MNNLDYLMVATATWYLTYCLVVLPGPRGIFSLLRKWFPVMTCKYCLSFWIAGIFYAFAYVGYTDVVNVFGLAGAAHLLSSWTGADYAPLPAYEP